MKRILTQIAMACTLMVSSVSTAEYEEPKINISDKDLDCLARNIYYESYGQPHKGMKAVAYVTLNRVLDPKYPKTVCAVVKQRNQFEWFNKGKWHIKNKAAYKDALIIAYTVVQNFDPKLDPTNGATMFHANFVKPKWNYRKLQKTIKIGGHVFYKES